ncbi:flagellar basal body protein [Jannaschia marina]|uniref:flagellar basal body protein n=1 Tax=Jannaschia marina TaxID=2741674 RepID=UPI001F25D2D8|nr:flagellar basal body protein [Jannaschia marina]
MPALLRLAGAAAAHAAREASVVAGNVANADTPGYKARALTPFTLDADFALRRSDPRHLAGLTPGSQVQVQRDLASDPNGNTVDLEDQILRGIEAARAHNRAVTVYRNNIELLRAALGRR